jgi:hypothetical protein
MRTPMSLWLLVLLPAGLAHGQPAPAPFRYDYSELFAEPIRSPLLADAKYFESGALALEKADFVTPPTALRVDCGKLQGRGLGVIFLLLGDQLKAVRGQPVVLRCQVKRLSGAGEVALRLRCYAKDWRFLYASHSVSLAGTAGQWQPLTLRTVVPSGPEVETADFVLDIENTTEPLRLLLDDCVLSLDTEAGQSAPSAFAAAVPESAKPLPLVSAGKPAATIVIPEKPSSALEYAVKEFNDHLQLSTGAALPVVKDGGAVNGPTIQIGATALSRQLGLAPEFLAPDSWVVRRVGEALILSGGDGDHAVAPLTGYGGLQPFGTLYAVYEFLERAVGVRWYWPGDLGRVVPRHADLAVGNVRWQGAPSYDTRFCWYANLRDEGYTDDEVWQWWRRMRWGGVGGSAIANHSFVGWNKLHGAAHPDWFALQRDGQRLNDPTLTGGLAGHLCLSNPEVLAQVVAELRDYFDKNPATKYHSVMPGDSDDLFHCQCDKCRAMLRPAEGPSGIHSYAVWTFVNQVAAQLRPSHPDRIVTCCAYSSYAKVPPDVYFEPNVSVSLCASQFPAQVWNPAVKSEYAAWIGEWARKSPRVYVWDYWNNPRYGGGTLGAPAVYPHAIQEWFLAERGRVKGHAIELSDIAAGGQSINGWANWMMDSLNVYVAMRLLWNMDQDVDGLLDEYYSSFYGPAGPLLRQFYGALEQAYLDPAGKAGAEGGWDFATCWLRTYPAPLVARSMGTLREAEKLTQGQEPYHSRVQKTLEGYLPFETNSQRYSAREGK